LLEFVIFSFKLWIEHTFGRNKIKVCELNKWHKIDGKICPHAFPLVQRYPM